MPKTRCASIRAKTHVSSTTQMPPFGVTEPSSMLPSFQNINFFGKDFMDSLLNFMQQSHNFLINWKQETGRQQYTMSTEERQVKIKQLTNLISHKEKELSDLQALKSRLTNDDTSTLFSTFSSLAEDYRGEQQESYDYSSTAFTEDCYGDPTPTTTDTQYSTSPAYTDYDTQALSSTSTQQQYDQQYNNYVDQTGREYSVADDGTKYYRSQ